MSRYLPILQRELRSTSTGAARLATIALATLASCGSGNDGTIPLADYQERANTTAHRRSIMDGIVQPITETNLATMGAEPFDQTELQHSTER